GEFMSAYGVNRDEAVENVTDADPVAAAVRALMAERTERTQWTGTATDLLGALTVVAGEAGRRSRTLPESPKGHSGRLRRAAPFLRKRGIEMDFHREGKSR